MKKTMLKLISLLLAVVFVYGAVCPVVIAEAAYENEAAVYGTNLPAEEETEDIEEEEPSLPPFLQFLINILEKLAALPGFGKDGSANKFFNWLIKNISVIDGRTMTLGFVSKIITDAYYFYKDWLFKK